MLAARARGVSHPRHARSALRCRAPGLPEPPSAADSVRDVPRRDGRVCPLCSNARIRRRLRPSRLRGDPRGLRRWSPVHVRSSVRFVGGRRLRDELRLRRHGNPRVCHRMRRRRRADSGRRLRARGGVRVGGHVPDPVVRVLDVKRRCLVRLRLDGRRLAPARSFSVHRPLRRPSRGVLVRRRKLHDRPGLFLRVVHDLCGRTMAHLRPALRARL